MCPAPSRSLLAVFRCREETATRTPYTPPGCLWVLVSLLYLGLVITDPSPSLHVQGWCQLLGAKAALRSPTPFAWACQALHRGVGSLLGRMGRGVLGGPWVAEDPGYPIPGPEASWADVAEAKLAVGISLCKPLSGPSAPSGTERSRSGG